VARHDQAWPRTASKSAVVVVHAAATAIFLISLHFQDRNSVLSSYAFGHRKGTSFPKLQKPNINNIKHLQAVWSS
jgi:hypothetical protein